MSFSFGPPLIDRHALGFPALAIADMPDNKPNIESGVGRDSALNFAFGELVHWSKPAP